MGAERDVPELDKEEDDVAAAELLLLEDEDKDELDDADADEDEDADEDDSASELEADSEDSDADDGVSELSRLICAGADLTGPTHKLPSRGLTSSLEPERILRRLLGRSAVALLDGLRTILEHGVS